MKLRCRLDDARLKLEDAQWRRKATLGDTVGPDGHEIKSEAEKEAALEVMNINKEFLQARHQAAHTHSKYMDIMTMYNDLNETARLEFQVRSNSHHHCSFFLHNDFHFTEIYRNRFLKTSFNSYRNKSYVSIYRYLA